MNVRKNLNFIRCKFENQCHETKNMSGDFFCRTIYWSNEDDLVYDPFIGSGTTAKMAILNKRNFIGSEISKDYCDIAEKRIEDIVSDK